MTDQPPYQPLLPFFFAPDLIIDRARHDPLTVAVYTGIARCCVAASGPVPLSAPDLAQWFGLTGEPGRVMVMRRMQRLITDGWIESTGVPGKKPYLQPTWGRARDGTIRLWAWETPDRGRPDWQRGRRVPLALFDDFIGRLVPHPAKPADHSSWWDCPLLDGKDLGTWVIGLRHDGESTPRLTHLGMTGTALLTRDELRKRVQSGTLTTLDEQGTVIGIGICHDTATSRTRSRTPGAIQSHGGSDSRIAHTGHSTAAGRDTPAETGAEGLIAWESYKLTNTMTPPKESDHQIGWGDDRFDVEQPAPTDPPNTRISTPGSSPNHPCACNEHHQLDPQVIAGHGALNPGIAIPPGEWLELARLEQQHGIAMLLIWQARATRRTQAASGRVVPAYYTACADREMVDSYRPRRHDMLPEHAPGLPNTTETADPDLIPSPRTSAAPAKPALAPEADRLLRAMGLRSRSTLAEVPLDLIRQWQPLIDHPALIARFSRDHRGWIWTQLRDQMEPPSTEELANWLRAADRQEPTNWRSVAATLGDLVRMGDDLSGLSDGADRPPLPALPNDATQRCENGSDQDVPQHAPPPTPIDDLAEQFRFEVRLRSGDRTLRQILDRAQIERCGDGVLLRCLTADLRLLLAHTAILRAVATGVGQRGNMQCVAL